MANFAISADLGCPYGQAGEGSGVRKPCDQLPDKVLFPADGITKGELASYYGTIAPFMLPHICGRPITMAVPFHRGIDAEGFFQKDVSEGFHKSGWTVQGTFEEGRDGTPSPGAERVPSDCSAPCGYN